MWELDAVPPVPLFDETFESMTIPGVLGVAVSRQTNESRFCVAVGRSDRDCRKVRLEGEPYRIVESMTIPVTEYDAFVAHIRELQMQNGIVAADVLDGEGFMVKWRAVDGEFRFVLLNPNYLESDRYQRIGTELAALIRDESGPWWRHAFSRMRRRFLNPIAWPELIRSFFRRLFAIPAPHIDAERALAIAAEELSCRGFPIDNCTIAEGLKTWTVWQGDYRGSPFVVIDQQTGKVIHFASLPR